MLKAEDDKTRTNCEEKLFERLYAVMYLKHVYPTFHPIKVLKVVDN